MKTKILIPIASLLLAINIAALAQDDKEKTAIKNVVARETEAFMNLDHKTWADSWLPATYAYWSYSDSTGTNFVDGWQNIEKTFEEYFRTQKPSNSKITNIWQEVRVYGNGAYVRFIQSVEDNIDKDQTSQVRVLEKKDGKWRVVCMNAIAKYK